MGTTINIKQNRFEHGMQGDVRNKNLTSQSQVFGASKVKHFDIYGDTKLKPFPALERFNTDTEKDFKIGVVGGIDTLYGLGVALDNWYGQDWDYRLGLTPSTSGSTEYVYVDLSVLSDDFWNNVSSDGSDIRFTRSLNNDTIEYLLYNFDSVAKTGFVLLDIIQPTNLFIYFGNDQAEATRLSNGFLGLSHFYPLEDSIDYAGIRDLTNGDVFSPVPALIGSGASGQDLVTDSGGSLGNSRTVSFLFQKTSNGGGKIIYDDFSTFDIYINPNQTIRLNVDSEFEGNLILDGTTPLANNTWYHIACTYSSGTRTIYLNGSLEATNTRDGAGGLETDGGAQLHIEPASNHIIDMVSISRLARRQSDIAAEYQMLTTNIWSQGTLQNKESVEFTYSGTQVYIKEFDGTWAELEQNGRIVRTFDYDPVYSFIQDETDIRKSFLISEFITEGNKRIYGTYTSGGFIETTALTELGLLIPSSSNPIMNYAADKTDYISLNSELDSYNGTEYVDNVFLAGTRINSMVNYGYNIALLGNTKIDRGSIEIWDLLNDDPTTVIDTGVGEQRVLVNIKGSLVAVSNNFIQNEYKSFGLPSLDFKQWQGRDKFTTVQSFKYPNYNPTFTDIRNGIINNNRSDLSNFSTFHAEPSLEDMGMWAIGKNEVNDTIGVSIPFDTSGIGRINQHHTVGNNIILITEDFEHWILNKDELYSQTSTFESMVIDAGIPNVKKHFNKFEITLDKELPQGQIISAYYRKENQDIYTKMFDFSQAGEKTWEANQNFDETPLDSFHELQIKIESTNGSASIVEWLVEVEYENEE